MSEYSDQEIDLRPYIEAVIDKWYWILGLGLLVGIFAYAASTFLINPTYEATALVSITEPRQRVELDPRIVTVEENQPLKAYPEIASSDELLTIVRSSVPEANQYSVQQLRSMLSATAGSDPSLLKLSARNQDPEVAAAISNGWAELFVSWANRAYGDSGDELLLFFEQRLEDAAEELQTTEQALIEYQGENRSLILENRLTALQQAHADLLAKEAEINLLLQDTESVLALTQDDSEEANATAADQFTALLLKLRAFGGPPSAEAETFSWQLQVGSENLSAIDGNNQDEQIRALREVLQVQAKQTQTAISDIEPLILKIQKEKQEANALESLMMRNVQVAQDAQSALALTVEEKRITSQDTNTGVNLASKSAVPSVPISPRKSLIAVAAIIGTILLVILLIILIVWWRPEETASAPTVGEETGAADHLLTASDKGS